MTMTTATTQRRKLTYEDYCNAPDDARYELIDGELIVAPAPNMEHQRSSRRLTYRIERLLMDTGLGEVFHAPFDVVLSQNDTVQPDLAFVSNERAHIITAANIQGAPDLAIEILSPSTAERDKTVKRELYARHGVREYWLVDTIARTISQLLLRGAEFELAGVFGPGETLTSPTLGGFQLDPADVV